MTNTNSLKFGTLDIIGAYYGTNAVEKMYMGTELVYGGSQPVYLTNVNIVGSLTETDGVLSNLSTSNYAQLPVVPDFSSASSFEIVMCATIAQFPTSGDNAILASAETNRRFVLSTYSGNIVKVAVGDSSGSSFQSFRLQSNTLQTNIKYWFKVIFTGTTYSLSISTDGTSYTVLDTYSSSEKPSYASDDNWNVGMSRSSTAGGALIGSIDLNECYIDINGSRFWTGRTANKLIQIPQMTSTTQGGFTVECNRYSAQYAPNWYTVFSPVPSQYFAGSNTSKPDMVGIKFPESKFISTIVINQSDNSNSIAHNGYITVTTDGTNYSQVTTFTMNTTLESTTSIPIGTNCRGYRLYFTDNVSPLYPSNGVAIEGVSTYTSA